MGRGKRHVRIHLKDVKGSLEGFAARRPVGGHYLIDRPKWVDKSHGDPVTTDLGASAEVPASNVLFIQVLG